MKPSHFALATLLIATAPAAFANTAQVNVTGTITPVACQIALANGGNFDLGEINAADLMSDRHTSIKDQTTEFSIDCAGATLFAVRAIDINEADNEESRNSRFTLGKTTAGENIGYFAAAINNPMAAADKLYTTYSFDGGVTWVSSREVPYFVERDGNLLGWTTANASASGPSPINKLTGQFTLSANINSSSSLTLHDDQKINGGMVMTVEYL